MGGFGVRVWVAGLSLACGAATAAFAQSGTVTSGVAIVSDYRSQGISASDLGPAVQGYAQWDSDDGAFGGVFVSTVDFGYPESPDYELNLYAGRTWRLDGGRTELRAEALLATYPDDRTPGPSFTYYEARLAATRAFGPLSLTGAAAFAPKGSFGSGHGGRLEIAAAHEPAPGWTLRAYAATGYSQRAVDHTSWELGVTRAFEDFAVEVKYLDTDLSRARCGGANICGAALVVGLTLFLPTLE
jgi:uncharacterized protein (TIGR02001 family)